MEMEHIARQAKAAAIQLAAADTDAKNQALANIARALRDQSEAIRTLGLLWQAIR